MIYNYQGHYLYNDEIIGNWNSRAIGVYFCGFLTAQNQLQPVYIGVGTGNGGMRDRLLCHLRDDYWPEATHFGYHLCDNAEEALRWEAEQILAHQPKYNERGK